MTNWSTITLTNEESNLNLVLVIVNICFVFTEECLHTPSTNAVRNISDAYDKLIQSNYKAQCSLLVAIKNMIWTQHEKNETIYEIIESLQHIFWHPSQQARHECYNGSIT